ncbi:RNA polymerase II transcription factor B subunit 1 [Didymosphaeria variabile]|uniref:RNA polymerase II transcription factor B subunit 1 n=1 Tax=Didymosphaeria variabile TaxID=1932322 RepID=A0A9W8XU57_9PLEO|nr:RNA polymerase II transcription factor B subunit 1 [Didymosphaeria variabile]KAJ4359593.1 RNA polymerase II transcription factor B subunit 1 [Didymosphaeria variabile]
MSEAAAQYKKKDGKITISADSRTVSWKANGGDLAVDVEIAAITNLQQTPATSAKASIKIVVQQPDQTDNHTFTFTSAAARDNQQSITAVLRKCIEDAKAKAAAPIAAPAAATPTPVPDNGGASAAMTIAQTLVGTPKEEDSYDNAKLLGDIALQRSLLNSNPALRHRFDQALRDKPDTISIIQFSNQFWATRVHLLRSHAVENTQGAGTYNVLSVVKPYLDKEGKVKLDVSKEQIVLIFAQHPLVKKVYNENVPPLSEGDFWSRFFHSRLLKKLRGERIKENIDTVDPKLDKYLNFNESANDAPQLLVPSVPRFLDVEGNEQNHSQRLGNRPDLSMRPATNEKVPILRVLNRMSEKMMAEVPPSDGAGRHGPAGMDEETYNQLQLRDLQRAADDNRIVLKLQDQSRFFSAGQGVHTSSSAATYAKRTPAQALSVVQQEIRSIGASQAQNGGINLQFLAGVEDESSSDDEPDVKKKPKVGSRSSRADATSQIVKAIRQRQRHGDDYLSSQAAVSSEQARQLGISESVLDNLAMAHNTTVEFLHYFWAVYYSGDAERANEVAKLIETLDKSLDRIKAVADTAEADRAAQIQRRQRDNDEYTQRTGRKRKFDPNSIKGGSKAVHGLVEPLVRAINAARQQYQTVLQEQLAQTQRLSAS